MRWHNELQVGTNCLFPLLVAGEEGRGPGAVPAVAAAALGTDVLKALARYAVTVAYKGPAVGKVVIACPYCRCGVGHQACV